MRVVIVLLLLPFLAPAQVGKGFPSLQVPASSRGLAMGNTGIAGAETNQQLSYNIAKTAFTQNFHQASVIYLPWLNAISDDMRFMGINYLASVFNSSALGVDLRYLDMGSVTTRDNNGASIASYAAREYNLGVSYALQVSRSAGLGVALRFADQQVFGEGSVGVPAHRYAVSADFGYYQSLQIGDINHRIEWGAVVSNLGAKKSQLPVLFGLGFGYHAFDIDAGMGWNLALDLSKGEEGIRAGAGVEVGFENQFFLRGGVNLEKQIDGNRKFFGLGVGYKGYVMDQSWGIDVHWLVPFGTVAVASPLQGAFGFSLFVNFGSFE